MAAVKWIPLESNPDVMNKCLKKLGVDGKLGISDVLSLDEEFLNTVSIPCHALLFLFPTTPKCMEYSNKQEELLKSKQEKLDDVYFMKQTVGNGCGTAALIHAVANNESHLNLQPDSVLKKFLDSTRNLSPEEKGKYFEQDMDISAMHEYCAKEGQTMAPNVDDEVNMHFTTFVNINDKLVELDGRKSGPILHGATTKESFLKDAFYACREYMQCDPENLNFSALTFGTM